MLRNFIKDSAIYVIPSFLSRGLSIILVPLYTRVLSPADYGSLDLLLIFASLVNLTIALEVSQGLARFYSTEKDPGKRITYASSGFWFTVLCYSLFTVLLLSLSGRVSLLVMGRAGLDKVFRTGLFYIWADGILRLVQNQFRWELKSKYFAATSLIVLFTTAAAAIFMTYQLSLGLLGLITGMLFGTLSGLVFAFWNLRKTFRFSFNFKSLKEMLLFSAPLVPSGISIFISRYIDRIIIRHFLTIEDLGIYSIAFRLASVVSLLMVGFQSALTPLIYSHYQEAETPKHLEKIFRFFVAFALIFYLLMSKFSYEILVLMTTPDYYSAAFLVQIMVPAILLSSMNIFAPGIALRKKTHIILFINTTGAFLNASLSWFLIPRLGVGGAAVSALIGYMFVFVLFMVYSQRFYKVPHKWIAIILAVSLTVLINWGIPAPKDSGVAAIALKSVSVLLVSAVVFITGLVKISELRSLGGLITARIKDLRK